uniref:mRNA stability protein n=1 Tax=Parastrongyloides trichosuri TaxID=131310 RepID=A0A0N4ZF41_PARTI
MDNLTDEQKQEELLKSHMAESGGIPNKPASKFLQKRLNQRKFFDSGDYNMNKEQEKKAHPRVHPLNQSCNEPVRVLPTNDTTTTNISKELDAINEDGLTVPTPENVPQRKSSILFPDVHSKLSPTPHIHHEQDELFSKN